MARDKCGGCSECEALDAKPELLPCNQTECEAKGWATACTWHGNECSGCDKCTMLLATDSGQRCANFCEEHPDGWAGACLHHEEMCGGCMPCQQNLEEPAGDQLAAALPCANFCRSEQRGWKVACNWYAEQCGGCNLCRATLDRSGNPCMNLCALEENACDADGRICSGCDECQPGSTATWPRRLPAPPLPHLELEL